MLYFQGLMGVPAPLEGLSAYPQAGRGGAAAGFTVWRLIFCARIRLKSSTPNGLTFDYQIFGKSIWAGGIFFATLENSAKTPIIQRFAGAKILFCFAKSIGEISAKKYYGDTFFARISGIIVSSSYFISRSCMPCLAQ